ncbi:hypothetical protein [Salinicoccus sp. HZC-1]|uniref:hypothetical protein n=1 Tax=Salinicoccus sp. HZC-1 TaxID=3385497 RepID=UPI00398B2E6A
MRGQQISEDPVSQIHRAANKLVKLRNESGFQFKIQKEIIFINPYFIFGSGDSASQNLFVMRNRSKQYFRSLGSNTAGRSAKVLSEEVARRITRDPYPTPVTDYSRLKLGLNCWKCGGYDLEIKRFSTVCCHCNYSETIERLIVRTAIEYAVLFPEERVMMRKIYEFLAHNVDTQKIQRWMSRYFHVVRNGSRSHYEIKHKNLHRTLQEGGYRSSYEHDPEFIFENHPRRHKLNLNYV